MKTRNYSAPAQFQLRLLTGAIDANAERDHNCLSNRDIRFLRDGNHALGVYVDEENPTDVPQQFEYMLSYAKALPKYLSDFQRYLLAYPNAKSENMSDMFYWAKVKFGSKPRCVSCTL